MQVSLTFKTPNAVEMALIDVEDEDERNTLRSLVEEYVRYGELITVEFDTEARSAKVLRCGT